MNNLNEENKEFNEIDLNKKIKNNDDNKNLIFIQEKAYSISYFKEGEKSNNKENKSNKEKHLKQYINKIQKEKNNINEISTAFTFSSISTKNPGLCARFNKLKNFSNSKKIKDIYCISNISSIENDKKPKHNSSINNLLNLNFNKNENSIFDKENLDINVINSLKEDKDFNNIFSPIISDIRNNNEIETEQHIIYDANYIKTNKTSNIEQLIKFNETENNIINKERVNKINNENKNINNIISYNKNANINKRNKEENKDISVKNKLYQYLNNINLDENNSMKEANLRLKLLNQKIINKKYLDINKNDENNTEFTYTGLKRYRRCSTPGLRQFTTRINYLKTKNLNDKKQNKINIIKNKIDSFCSLTTNTKYVNNNNLKLNNKIKNFSMEKMYRSISKPNVSNKQETNLKNILCGLNKTIKKIPKKEIKLDYKLNMNNTSRTFPINYFENNKINNLIKSSKNKIVNKNYFNNYKNEFKIKYNEFNEKNEKLIFETKVNNMNNAIYKLLQKTPDFYNKNNSTQPANVFRKNKSITNICINNNYKSIW